MWNELGSWVVGGGMKQAKPTELPAVDGYAVHVYALERLGALDGVEVEKNLEGAALVDCMVLPLPTAGEDNLLNAPLSGRRHPLALVLDTLRLGQMVCAGMMSPQTTALIADWELILRDYLAWEELVAVNMVPTVLPVGRHSARREYTAPPPAIPGAGLNCQPAEGFWASAQWMSMEVKQLWIKAWKH